LATQLKPRKPALGDGFLDRYFTAIRRFGAGGSKNALLAVGQRGSEEVIDKVPVLFL
jgi:hypothetical protein